MSITINPLNLSYTIYKYKLKNYPSVATTQYILAVVFDVPYASTDFSDSNRLYIETFDIKKFDIEKYPIWLSYPKGSGVVPYRFLENYEDDLFSLTQESASSSDPSLIRWNFTLKKPSGDSLYTQAYSSISTSSYPVYISISPVFFKFTDNVYLAQNENVIKNYFFNTIKAYSGEELEIPSNQVSKGLLSHDITFSYTAYNWNASYIDNDTDTWIRTFLKNSKKYDSKDPNNPSGDSQGAGGDGDDDIGGNPHKTGEIPTISALDTGLITLYNPTTTQLQELGQFLWSDSFDINSFKKLFNDPFDTLLGLSIVPIKPTISATHNIMFGNLDSGVSSNVVAKQWVSIDCGSFSLNEIWHGALDYQPSTQVSIYLPFIGVRQLNVNDVMGSVMHLYYTFDVLTGTCIAEITINHSGQGNKSGGFSYNADMGSVYTFEGQCAVNIPLASQDFTNTIRAAIGAVGMVSGAAASFAAGHPALGTAALMMGTANAEIATHTPTIERSGHLSSSSALMSSLEPCLFVQRAHICKPERYYALRGVPSQVYVSALSQATGYFEIADVQNIHASGASDSELTEIKQLLTQGVFVDSWS